MNIYNARLEQILKRKSPLLVLRLIRLHWGKKYVLDHKYQQLVDKLQTYYPSNDWDNYRDEDSRLIVARGFNIVRKCPICSNTFVFKKGSGKTYCSLKCHAVDPNIKKKKSRGSKAAWQNPEYIARQKEGHSKRWSKKNSGKDWYEKCIVKIDTKKRRDTALATKLNKGLISEIVFGKKDPKYRAYRNKVNVITGFNRREYFSNIVFTKHGKHLDHIYPIQQGYVNNIPPELIGDLNNLQVLGASLNLKKTNKIETIPQHIQEYINDKD